MKYCLLSFRSPVSLDLENFYVIWYFKIVFSLASQMIQIYLAVGVLAICLYFKYKCSYWFRKNVDGPGEKLVDFVLK